MRDLDQNHFCQELDLGVEEVAGAIRLRSEALARFSSVVYPYVDRLLALVRDEALILDLRAGDGYGLLNGRWPRRQACFVDDHIVRRRVGDPLSHPRLSSGFQPTLSLPIRTQMVAESLSCQWH